MPLTGQQYQQFMEALLDAFRSEQQLKELLRFRLDKNLAEIASGGDLRAVAFALIDVAEAEGWTERLIVAARDSRPGNPELRVFAEQFGLAPATPPQRDVERSIASAEGFLDVAHWRQRLGEIETQVCRVERQGSGFATGFLVGPDAVITCQYVMADAIVGKLNPEVFEFRFDYKVMTDGTINPGKAYRLASDWLIDQSPIPPGAVVTGSIPELPQAGEFDYALLRLDGAPGRDQVGLRPEPDAPQRGWIAAPTGPYAFEPGSELYIVHHPRAGPLKVSLNDRAVIAMNANGTRVTYQVTTEGGSGGSPCFNANWELVAMHEGAYLDREEPTQGSVGVGIPFHAIVKRLYERGFAGAIGG